MEQQLYYQQTAYSKPQNAPQFMPSSYSANEPHYQMNGNLPPITSNQTQSYQNQANMMSAPNQQKYGMPSHSVAPIMTKPLPQTQPIDPQYYQTPQQHQQQQHHQQQQQHQQHQQQQQFSQQSRSNQMNNLTEQMSDISLGNAPQITQTNSSYSQQTIAQQSQQQLQRPPPVQTPFGSQQQQPLPTGGHQNWQNQVTQQPQQTQLASRPPMLPNASSDNWNARQLPPVVPQYAQTQQTNRFATYQQHKPIETVGQQLPPMPPSMAPPMQPSMPPSMPPSMQPQAQSMPPRYAAPNQMNQPIQQPSYGFANQQTQQRLDPEAMPSVVQVIEDDIIKYSNNDILFTTTIPASVPPLVTTIAQNKYGITNDGGCARPNYLRSSIYQVPISEDTLKTTSIPLAIVVQPFDELEVDSKMMVPISNSEIVRCNRCKAYMNPYMRFIDGGRRFQCSLCHHISEVTSSYFAHLDHTGQRLDKFNRPELYLGSYEFRATEEYCRNGILNARRPHIIFACELTATSKPILNHLSVHLPQMIKDLLPRDPLNPGSAPPLIGFVTYNSKIQIYDIVNNGHSHIICDIASAFPPITTFLVDPVTCFEQIETFFHSLPTLYSDDEIETQTVLGPVIEAALYTCQVDSRNWITNRAENNSQQNADKESIPVGKIYLFHCTLPNYGTDASTPGRLKPRWNTSIDEARKLLGTDKEKTILSPDSNKYYTTLGQRCVTEFASGVELFLFPPINGSYLDVATLSELIRLSGTGAIYKYFNDFSDRFLSDLKYSIRSSFAFDAILKVRTSTGIRAHDYIGNYYARTTSDIECAAINTGCNIAVELKYDDKLPEDEFVVIQVAVLYTSLSGERRVRVHNTALSSCQQVADVYRNACCDTTVNVLVRQIVSSLRMGEKAVQQSKELLITRAINILTAYRRHCAQPGSSLGQLILPEALKLLPMYICGFLKCDAVDGGPEMTPDDKAFAQIKLIGASLSLSQVILYPKLLKIEYGDQKDQKSVLNCTQIRCSTHKINSASAMAYLLENGFYILFYIPNIMPSANQQFLSSVFGPNVDSISKIQPELGLPKLLTYESQFINEIVQNIENERKKAMRIYIIRQGIDKYEAVFRSFLYEDKKPSINSVAGDGVKLEAPSYVDLLCHLHKEIRAQLN